MEHTRPDWWPRNPYAPHLCVQETKDQHPTVRKIKAFRHLSDGWHYGEGVSFKDGVLNDAIEFHGFIVSIGFYETDAFPGIDGSVILTLYHRYDRLEFVFEPNVDRWGSITAARYWVWQKCDEAIWNAIVRNAGKSQEETTA